MCIEIIKKKIIIKKINPKRCTGDGSYLSLKRGSQSPLFLHGSYKEQLLELLLFLATVKKHQVY